MPNTFGPFGAQDYVHQGGSQRTEELMTAFIASSDVTPIFSGDLVVGATPTSSAMLTGGFGMYVTQGSSLTTGYWRGVFRDCEFYNPTIQRMQVSRYWPGAGIAGTSSNTGDIKCHIVTDPQMRFVIQNSSNAIAGSSQIGSGIPVGGNGATGTPSSAVGNTFTQLSGIAALSSLSGTLSSAADAIFPFRLVDFYSNVAPGNPLAQTPSAGGGGAPFVNGTDNTTAGQWLIVEPLAWDNRKV